MNRFTTRTAPLGYPAVRAAHLAEAPLTNTVSSGEDPELSFLFILTMGFFILCIGNIILP